MSEYYQFIFPGKLFHPNSFRFRLIRAFFYVWFFENKFQLNSVHQFLQCTFRLQQSFTILSSSNFALIPNLSFLADLVYNGENRLSISFFIFEKYDANIGDHLRKGSNFEQRERIYTNTWGGGGRARGQKLLENHLYLIPFVFVTICVHSAFTFMRI